MSAGDVVVVKCGGSVLGDRGAADAFAKQISALHNEGVQLVVVHGGGPQIGEMLIGLGKEPQFIDGLRATDAETLDVVRTVLWGMVNRQLVGALLGQAVHAFGMSGEDGATIVARQRDPRLGFVGDVASVNRSLIDQLLSDGALPVIATLGVDSTGQAYNINADTAAGAIAGALQARKLVLLTDVPGLLADVSDRSSVIESIASRELEQLVSAGALTGGMIPKATACLDALHAGVPVVQMVDGSDIHALAAAVAGEKYGTTVTS